MAKARIIKFTHIHIHIRTHICTYLCVCVIVLQLESLPHSHSLSEKRPFMRILHALRSAGCAHTDVVVVVAAASVSASAVALPACCSLFFAAQNSLHCALS